PCEDQAGRKNSHSKTVVEIGLKKEEVGENLSP
ncbi:rCG41984, partial [Rattus norvegicus]